MVAERSFKHVILIRLLYGSMWFFLITPLECLRPEKSFEIFQNFINLDYDYRERVAYNDCEQATGGWGAHRERMNIKRVVHFEIGF